MNKPLGYYTPHTPGDGTLLDQLEQLYGSYFQKFNQHEKFYIINYIAMNLCATSSGETSTEAMQAVNSILGLDPSTKLGIIRFLADNSSANNEFINSPCQTTPDPNWDYFDAWGTLHEAKQRIDKALSLMADKEQADASTNGKVKEMLTTIVNDFDSAILLYFN